MESKFTKKDQAWIEIAKELFKASQYRKQYAELEEKLKSKLIDMSDGKPSYGGGYKFENILVKGRVDYTIIPEIQNINLELYRKAASVSWKLTPVSTEVIDSINL